MKVPVKVISGNHKKVASKEKVSKEQSGMMMSVDVTA